MIRKVLCKLGYHTWVYDLQDAIKEFGYLPLDNRVPKLAKCEHCGCTYK